MASPSSPALNGLSQPANQSSLCLTHLLHRPPPESTSTGMDRLCRGRSGRTGAGMLHAAVPAPAQGLESRLKHMCLRGKANSAFPWTPTGRRSQHGTEHGFATERSSRGGRVNTELSGISQTLLEDNRKTKNIKNNEGDKSGLDVERLFWHKRRKKMPLMR